MNNRVLVHMEKSACADRSDREVGSDNNDNIRIFFFLRNLLSSVCISNVT